MHTNMNFVGLALAIFVVSITVDDCWPSEIMDEDGGHSEENQFAGRFVDQAGEPIAGVSIYVGRRTPLLVGMSEPDGRFCVAGILRPSDKQRKVSLVARKRWYVTKRWTALAKARETIYLGDIVLESGGAVSGRIIDSNGKALSGAEVCCTGGSNLNLSFYLRPEIRSEKNEKTPNLPIVHMVGDKAVSAEDGTFRVDGVPAGQIRVWAGGADAFVKWTDPIEVRHGSATPDVVLALDLITSEHRVDGTVLNPEGVPYPHAKLDVASKVSKEWGKRGARGNIFVDDQGRYSFVTNCTAPLSLIAHDTEGKYGQAQLQNVLLGSPNAILQLTSRDALFLKVRDDGGHLVESFTVNVFTIDEDIPEGLSERLSNLLFNMESSFDFTESDLVEDGLSEIPVPERKFRLAVKADGYKDATVGPFSPNSCPKTIEVSLTAESRFAGRVMSKDGPIHGAKVGLYRAVSSDMMCTVCDFVCRSEPSPVATARTDGDGKFYLTPSIFSDDREGQFERSMDGPLSDWAARKKADYFVRAEAEGFAPGDFGPIESESNMSDLRLVLTRGGSIEGRVRGKPGQSSGGIVVAVSRGDGFPQSTRTDPEGNYRFEQLTPGEWQVEPREADISPNRTPWGIGDREFDDPVVPVNWACSVKEGETTRYDLNLTAKTKGVLIGTIRFESDLVTGYVVEIECLNFFDSDFIPAVKVGVDGKFRIEDLNPGGYLLVIKPLMGAGPRIEIGHKMRIESGENVWDFAPALGRLELRGIPRVTGDVESVYYHWMLESYECILENVQPDAQGSVVIPIIPAGRGKLGVFKWFRERGRDVEKIYKEIDIPVDGTATVDLEQG